MLKFKELILEKDTIFEESIEVENSIRCVEGFKFSLKVKGDIYAGDINARNINAGNIDAWNIDAKNIDAGNIDAWNIDAKNIDAGNIDAWNINAENIDAEDIDAQGIFCEKRIKKDENSKTTAKIFIQEKSKLEKKEW